MATILDALVIELGLDTTGFDQSRANVSAAQRQMANDAASFAQRVARKLAVL